MSFAFYDRENLYLVMDLLLGGDLRFHLGKMRRFSEN
jgi:serine/threonine kinase 32